MGMSDGFAMATGASAPSVSLYSAYGFHVHVASLLHLWQWLALISTVFYFMHRAIVAIIRRHQESVYWNWDNGGDDVTVPREVINTDVDALAFPPDFLFGVATSAHQIEGGDGGLNQWSAWESAKDKQGVVSNSSGSCSSSGYSEGCGSIRQSSVPTHFASCPCPFSLSASVPHQRRQSRVERWSALAARR